jgi:hypothetical protein
VNVHVVGTPAQQPTQQTAQATGTEQPATVAQPEAAAIVVPIEDEKAEEPSVPYAPEEEVKLNDDELQNANEEHHEVFRLHS